MRTSATLSVMLATALVICCSQAENKNATAKPTVAPAQTVVPNVSTSASTAATPFVSNAPISNAGGPPGSRVKSLSPEGGDRPTAAEFDDYAYSYKTDGGKTDATFSPKLLPADRDIVAGAIRDVIYRSYGDKIDSTPHIEDTGPAQTIRIDSSKHRYIVVPSSEPTGEIHSLIITRLK